MRPNIDLIVAGKIKGIAAVVDCSSVAYGHDTLTTELTKELIATGAAPFIPPIPHFREAGNVFTFRDLSDAIVKDGKLTGYLALGDISNTGLICTS